MAGFFCLVFPFLVDLLVSLAAFKLVSADKRGVTVDVST